MKLRENAARHDWIARGLGWFSIGLGVGQIVAPRRLSRWIGIREHPALMRMLGARETMSGIGILAQNRPAAALWSRVAGDAMDLALLGIAAGSRNSKKRKVAAATAAVAGVTALDSFAAVRLAKAEKWSLARTAMTINRSPAEVYEFWRNEDNLNQFMRSVPSRIEIVSARPNELIEWRSADGVTVKSASVSIMPAFGRNGTEIRESVDGLIPSWLLHEDLRRAKNLLETGEIPTTEGQSAGPRAGAVVARLVHRLEGKEVA